MEIDRIKEEINTKTDTEELKKLKAKLRAKEIRYKSSLEEYEAEFSQDAAVVHVYFKVLSENTILLWHLKRNI